MDEVNETPRAASTSESAFEERERHLLRRLAAVERDLVEVSGRSRWLGLGMVVALAAAVLSAIRPGFLDLATAGVPKTIEVGRLVLVAEDGTPRGEWSVDESGNSVLSLLDRQRHARLSLTVRSEGFPGLSLANAAGERRVALGLLPDETTSLVFADGAGVPRTVLGLVRGDAASLVLADAQGVSRIGFGLDGQGVGSVILPDEEL